MDWGGCDGSDALTLLKISVRKCFVRANWILEPSEYFGWGSLSSKHLFRSSDAYGMCAVAFRGLEGVRSSLQLWQLVPVRRNGVRGGVGGGAVVGRVRRPTAARGKGERRDGEGLGAHQPPRGRPAGDAVSTRENEPAPEPNV